MFRIWAPAQRRVEVALEGRADFPMRRSHDGFFEAFVKGARHGARYRFVLDDGTRVPDPASRFQPDDAHGASELVDPAAFRWRTNWRGLDWDDVVLYELHVGAFTPEGTFAAATTKLAHLVDLGVTAVQIMPLGDFPGAWGWGYDGVLPYAPDSSYGRPEDLKAFIDAAHHLGAAVLLDVVYNHFGPAGNYLPLYAPDFFNPRVPTPWGEAINFDGPNAGRVRDFFIENAEYWIEEFRLDGLRLDAVHAIRDDSIPDILDEMTKRLRGRYGDRIHIVVENDDNVAAHLARRAGRPLRFTAQWNDDIHHALHVAATGENGGHYAAYGSTRLLAKALAEGYAYPGDGPAKSVDLPPNAFVGFLQNHDQMGNRPFGERLNRLIAPEAMRALASVTLISPQTPGLFMGEEWGAREPFLFFCDFRGALAEAVRSGRRRDYARFPQYRDPTVVARFPDPTAQSSFDASKLDWNHIDAEQLSFYRAALTARRTHVRPLLPGIGRGGVARVLGEQALRVTWRAGDGKLTLDANLSSARVAFPPAKGRVFWRYGEAESALGPWSVRWSAP